MMLFKEKLTRQKSFVYSHIIELRNLSSFLSFKVIDAVLPQAHMSYFDVEEKVWR